MNQYRLFLMLFLFSYTTLFAQKPAAPEAVSSEDFTKIEVLLDAYKTKYNVPAMSVAIVSDGAANFIHKGTFARSSNKEVDEHSVFQIASVSKPLTGIIINQLLMEGKLELEASITSYLPSSYSQKTLDKLKKIKVRDLLHHRSGLPGDSPTLRRKRKGNKAFIYDYSELDFEKDLKKVRIKKMGEYSYSNFGFALLGYLAERATGKSYEELLQTYIGTKYNLSQTSTSVINPENLVTAYRKDKRLLEIEPWVMGKLVPPSGIFSTTSDLSNLLLEQLQAYKEKKKSSLILTNDMRPIVDNTAIKYGYGIVQFGSMGVFGHSGEMDGFAADYSFYPNQQKGIVILSSCSGDELKLLSRDIARIVYEVK